jgi:simple sugar transport system permease protein
MKNKAKAAKTAGVRGLYNIKRSGDYSQLLIPLISLLILIAFNAIRDVGFFSIGIIENNQGYLVLSGNIISILNGASELAILAMGMTLVTSACGGQDISVGAAAAIAGSVFVKVLRGGEAITPELVILAFIACCAVAVVFGAFNGILVAAFNIQPMIATLILFTAGRSIAYWINGGATPTVASPIISALGGFIPGVPIPTPVIIVVVCGIIFALLFKFTNLGLYTQAVGINFRAARLNGINTTWIKLLSFMILGICCAVAGCISVGRLGLINHETLLLEIEMDAILAVAIGGNALGGGKFKMAGSVLGAYAIQTLTTTLYAMKVPSTSIKAYKAIVIILIVLLGSPVVKEAANRLKLRLARGKEPAVMEGK